MSRSRRKNPFCGNTTAESDKPWKREIHARVRAAERRGDFSIVNFRRIGGYGDKDGKTRFDVARFPELLRKLNRPLTDIERNIIRFVARNQPCTYEDVRLRMGYKSKSTAFQHVRRLRYLDILTAPRTAWGNSISRGLMLGKDVLVSDKGDIYWIAQMDGFREVLHGSEGVLAAAT